MDEMDSIFDDLSDKLDKIIARLLQQQFSVSSSHFDQISHVASASAFENSCRVGEKITLDVDGQSLTNISTPIKNHQPVLSSTIDDVLILKDSEDNEVEEQEQCACTFFEFHSADITVEFFEELPERDLMSWNAELCSEFQHLKKGNQVHQSVCSHMFSLYSQGICMTKENLIPRLRTIATSAFVEKMQIRDNLNITGKFRKNALKAGHTYAKRVELIDITLVSGKTFDGGGFKFNKESFDAGHLHLIVSLSDGCVQFQLEQWQLLLKSACEHGADKIHVYIIVACVLEGSNVAFVKTLDNELANLPTKPLDAQVAYGGDRRYAIIDCYENGYGVVQGRGVAQFLGETTNKFRNAVETMKKLLEDPNNNPHYISSFVKVDVNGKAVVVLHSSYKNGPCNMLRHDVGMGKTIQAIGFLAVVIRTDVALVEEHDSLHIKVTKGPKMIPYPASNTHNWDNEFWAWPAFDVVVYHGSNYEVTLEKLQAHGIAMLTSVNPFKIQDIYPINGKTSAIYDGTKRQNKILELFKLSKFYDPYIDLLPMMAQKVKATSDFTLDIEGFFKKNKVNYVHGFVNLVSPSEVLTDTIHVGSVVVQGEHIIMTIGSDMKFILAIIINKNKISFIVNLNIKMQGDGLSATYLQLVHSFASGFAIVVDPIGALSDGIIRQELVNPNSGKSHLFYQFVVIPSLVVAISISDNFSFDAMYGIDMVALVMLRIIIIGLTNGVSSPVSANLEELREWLPCITKVLKRTVVSDVAANASAAIGNDFAISSAALVFLELHYYIGGAWDNSRKHIEGILTS